METVGLLAGTGRLPVNFAVAAKKAGLQVFAIGLVESVDTELASVTECFVKINIAKLNAIIEFFKEHNIKQVTMLGKVTKELLFNGQHDQIDSRMMKLLASLPNRSDDTLMLAFVRELASEGMKTIDQTTLLKLIMPKAGALSKKKPTREQMDDVKFGFVVAKKIGELDIGQTVVVKNKAVMAVEAIEGTDKCILRGGALAQKDAVVVKTAKPQQDNRFDVPAVGIKTIESMLKAKARVLAIEANRTILVDREKVLALAEENELVIVAL